MPAAKAFQFDIGAGTYDLPFVASAGMLFFHNDDIAAGKIFRHFIDRSVSFLIQSIILYAQGK